MSLAKYKKLKQTMEKSTCPVCEQKAFIWSALGAECMNCFWWPVSIPYSDEEVQEAKIKLEQIKNG
jgi:hypothetical protein